MAPTAKKPARKVRTSRDPRIRQLVPLIENLPPELRDLVVQQVDALVSLVIMLEKYAQRREPSRRPKAAKVLRKGAGRV